MGTPTPTPPTNAPTKALTNAPTNTPTAAPTLSEADEIKVKAEAASRAAKIETERARVADETAAWQTAGCAELAPGIALQADLAKCVMKNDATGVMKPKAAESSDAAGALSISKEATRCTKDAYGFMVGGKFKEGAWSRRTFPSLCVLLP